MTHRKPEVVWVCVAVAATFIASVMSQELAVPDIPESQGDSSLANLWRQALRKQPDQRADNTLAKTFFSPGYIEVVNWVPQDSAHPLYVDKYRGLLAEILLDYMSEEEVKPDDPRFSQPDGFPVTTLSGKTITLKTTDGVTTANDVPVTSSKINDDGTISYVLSRSLFNHRQKVNEAWEENNKNNPSRFGPLGPVPGVPPQP